MKRDYTLFIEDILDAIRKIEKFTKGLSEKEFLRDGKTQSAVAWEIMTIGEAAKNIPHHIRKKIRPDSVARYGKNEK